MDNGAWDEGWGEGRPGLEVWAAREVCMWGSGAGQARGHKNLAGDKNRGG